MCPPSSWPDKKPGLVNSTMLANHEEVKLLSPLSETVRASIQATLARFKYLAASI